MSKSVLELYHLINSLEKTEKAYFIKFGFKYKKKGTPIYELYNLIDSALKKKKTIVNTKLENKIKEAFSESFPKVSFASTKLKLLNDLLDALVKYNQQQESANNLLLLLQKITILIDKGFIDYAIKQLRINLNNPILEKNEELKALFYSTLINAHYKNNDIANIIAHKQDYFSLVEKMYQKTSLSVLYDKIYTIHTRYGNIEKSEEVKKEVEMIKSSLNDISIDGQNLKFTFNYYSAHQILSIVENNYEKAFQYTDLLFSLSRKNQEALNLTEHQVYGLLANLIIDSLNHGIKDFFIKYIDELKANKIDSDLNKYKTYLFLKCQLNHQYLTQNFSTLNNWIDFFKQYDSINCFSDKQKIYLLSDFSIASYIVGNESLFLEFSNKLLSYSSKTNKVDEIEKTTYLALLTYFFDTRDMELFEYHLNSFESRFINSKDNKEYKMLLVFKLLGVLRTSIKESKPNAAIISALNKVEFQKLKNVSIGFFDIKLWLDGKLERKSYSEKIKMHLKGHFKG